MNEMLLDRNGTAPVPDGYLLVTSEVAFLRVATERQTLLVRGERLCECALVFCRGRNIPFAEIASINEELKTVCPGMTDKEAKELAAKLGDNGLNLPRPITAEDLLEILHPAPVWRGDASVKHAAEWLLWLRSPEYDAELQPLLRQIQQKWQNSTGGPERIVYGICTPDDALQQLEGWLGIRDRLAFPIRDEFPLDVPAELLERARTAWRQQAIKTRGSLIDSIGGMALPFKLEQIAAGETLAYYISNPEELTPGRVNQFTKFLAQKDMNRLRKCRAPALPSKLPEEGQAVLNWFRDEYLPYREWQASSGAAIAKRHITDSASEFTQWYLDEYPKALNGAPLQVHLSYKKASDLSIDNEVLTLVVVLDGLHAGDARSLLQAIRSEVPRLRVVDDGLAFCPIPTTTEFAKESLFHGVPPNRVREVGPIGEILAEDKSPAYRLAQAEPPNVFLWRVLEPDRTYHQRNRSENLVHDVQGRLEAEASKIQEVVETVPDNVLMQVVITTDHGRLIGRAERDRPVPDRMQAHSRVAWGSSVMKFPESGFRTEGGITYLLGDKFGLDFDLAIPMDDSAFVTKDGQTGSEASPHGGLYPEEVIVPWIVLARDHEKPQVDITLSGRGRARQLGSLLVRATNAGHIDVMLESVLLTYRSGFQQRLQVALLVKPEAECEARLPLQPWPSAADLPCSSAIASVRLPNRLVFECITEVRIESEDMYARDEGILEDLD